MIPGGALRAVMTFATAAAAVAGLVGIGSGVGEPRVVPAGPVWTWPIGHGHRVVAPYRAPPTRYAAGHRGVDLAASAGEEVRAVAPGTVVFAGVVVDRPLIVVRHAGGIRSSVEPVRASVSVGDVVTTGQPVGVVAAGGHCGTACLHLGARLGDDYLNPMLLLGSVPRAVLLPVEAAARAAVPGARGAGQARGWAALYEARRRSTVTWV